jgi:hypothetical protein
MQTNRVKRKQLQGDIMNLLEVGDGKYVNTDRITYINAVKKDKVIIMFQNEVGIGGIGIPASYLELKGAEAQRLLQWLQTNAAQMKLP